MEINATFLGQAVAFVIFVYLCMKWVWPPLVQTLEKRQKEIADGLAYAEKAKKNEELAKVASAEALRAAKAEAQKIIEDAQKQRSMILDKATEEANAQKNRIVASATAEIESLQNKVREELRAEAINLAVLGAEQILNKEVDAKSDNELINKILEKV